MYLILAMLFIQAGAVYAFAPASVPAVVNQDVRDVVFTSELPRYIRVKDVKSEALIFEGRVNPGSPVTVRFLMNNQHRVSVYEPQADGVRAMYLGTFIEYGNHWQLTSMHINADGSLNTIAERVYEGRDNLVRLAGAPASTVMR